MLYYTQNIDGIIVCLLTLLTLWQPFKLLSVPQQQRVQLTPMTGRFYFIFSVAFLATIWIPLP